MKVESLPSLGAWIETSPIGSYRVRIPRRSLHWERGLNLCPTSWQKIDRVAPFIGSVD